MKKLVALLAVSLLLSVVAIVYAQGPGMMGEGSEMEHGMMGMMGKGSEMGPGMMGEHHLMGKLMSLGLDEKQKEAIKEIIRKTMRENIKKRADLHIARIDLGDLLDKDSVNMTSVESKLKEIASLETDIRLSRIKAHEEIKSILTPDQRKKLKEMGKMGMMQGKGYGMKGGKMKRGNMETEIPSSEEGEEMPGMEHGD